MQVDASTTRRLERKLTNQKKIKVEGQSHTRKANEDRAEKMMMPQETRLAAANGQLQLKQQRPIAKLRRTRQPRNPQLSVARRNERERNRVKQVNNGFATLRDHLPVEYLQREAAAAAAAAAAAGSECGAGTGADDTGSDTPDLFGSGGASSGSKSTTTKTKKCSKVETLRSAIQYIKMLNQLIELSDMKVEPIQVTDCQPATSCYDDVDGQLSVGEPQSCGTPLSSSSSSMQQAAHLSQQQQQQLASQQQQQHLYSQPEQFIKLEPQQQQQQQHNHIGHILPPSPTASLAAAAAADQSNCQQAQAMQQQQQQQHTYLGQSPLMGQEQSSSNQQHTQLWIQRHQSSFVEQQQLIDWQQQQHHQHQLHHQQHHINQQHYFQVQCQQSPVSEITAASPSQLQRHHLDWYTNSPPQQQATSSPPSANSAPGAAGGLSPFGQQHQISLYSQ